MGSTVERLATHPAATRPHEPASASPPPPAPLKSQVSYALAVGVNLALAISLGTAISSWFLYHTDYFPAIGTVLALGGVFSWVAFVSKLLTEDRLTTIQSGFESYALGRWWLTSVLVALWVVAAAAGAQFGSVRLNSVEDAAERSVYFAARGTDFGRDSDRLKVGDQITRVFRTPWFGSTSVDVKVKGYPHRQATVSWLHREELRVPADFVRPAILLRPAVSMLDLRQHGLRIHVKVDGDEYEPVTFDGSALWLGCSADVEVPSFYQGLLRAELQSRQDLLGYVLFPKVLSPKPLAEGAKVTVTIFTARHTSWGKPKTITVLPVRRIEDFPQVLVLEPDVQASVQPEVQPNDQ